MRLHAFAIASAIALLLPLTSRASEHESDYGPDAGDVEFTLGANGNNDKEFDAGAFNLSTSLGYFLTEALEAGVRHDMTFFDANNVESTFAAVTRGFADLHLDLGRVRPFVGANVGVRYGNGAVDETGTLAPEWGFKFYALEKAFIVASMEYQWFFKDVEDADDRSSDGQFVYGLGIGFNF